MSGPSPADPPPRRGGRPTAEAAALLEGTILDAAEAAFLRDGYAATSIERLARACQVGKRTIYARWADKPALFRAVLERLMARWLSHAGDWAGSPGLEAALRSAADSILGVALTPEAVALYRLLVAESARFPELPAMLRQAGADQGGRRVAALLQAAVEQGALPAQDTAFAAAQFMHMLLAEPQRRALGLGPALGTDGIASWRDATIRLFLGGARSLRLPPPTD